MENLLGSLMFFMLLIGGGKILIFYHLQKMKKNIAIAGQNSFDRYNHYNYVYSQEEIYNSMYPQIQSKFKFCIQTSQLDSEQIKFLERYLRRELQDHGHYKNNAHAIYSMLKSPQLSNSNYLQIERMLEDFTHNK